jgi:hypothetical protein
MIVEAISYRSFKPHVQHPSLEFPQPSLAVISLKVTLSNVCKTNSKKLELLKLLGTSSPSLSRRCHPPTEKHFLADIHRKKNPVEASKNCSRHISVFCISGGHIIKFRAPFSIPNCVSKVLRDSHVALHLFMADEARRLEGMAH